MLQNNIVLIASTLADRVSKLAKPRYRHPGDYNVLAARLGWLPSYPTFNKGSQELINDARAAGAGTEAGN